MADPFTLATGVASIISIAIQLATVTNDLTRYTKEAFSAPQQLLEELRALSAVLKQLQDVLNSHDSGLNFTKTSTLCVASRGCEARLSGILQKLQKRSHTGTTGKGTGKLSHALQRIRWPLEAKETREAAQDIHRYAQVFVFALTIEGCDILSKTFAVFNKSSTRQQDDAVGIMDAMRALPNHKDDFDRLNEHIEEVKIQNKQLESNKEWEKLSNLMPAFSSHRKHQDSLFKHQSGTCRWFINDKRFTSWERGDSENILWAHGAPGAGKTILTSFVIEHLRNLLGHRHISYIYCDYQDEDQRSASRLAISLLWQLVKSDEGIFDILRKSWAQSMEDQRYWLPHVWHTLSLPWIMSVMRQVVRYEKNIFVVIDGLDEIPEYSERGEEIRPQFVKFLKELPPNYRVLVTSRSHLDLETSFKPCEQIIISPSKSDIHALVLSELSTSTRFRRLLGENATGVMNDLAQALANRCSGMFLMARFQLNQLSSVVNTRQLHSILEHTPVKLHDFYQTQIARLQKLTHYERELSIRVLSWVLACKRPLSIKELVAGLAVEDGDTRVDSTGFIDIKLILEVCGGLIHLAGPGDNTDVFEDDPEQQVRFVHATVQEYIVEHKDELFTTDPDWDIFQSCYTYMSFAQIHTFKGTADSLRKEYPFLAYAVNHWAAHLPGVISDQDHSALMHITMPWVDQAQNATRSFSEIRNPDTSEISNGIWSLWTNPDFNYSSWRLREMVASHTYEWYSSCQDVVSLSLLHFEENKNAFRWFVQHAWNPLMLQVAVADNVPDLKNLITSLNAEGIRTDQYDHTKDGVYPPILEAINMSNRQLVEQLLTAGHNPNMRWKPGAYHGTKFHMLTPLEAAVQRSWKPVVRMLLDAGADPDVGGGKYGSAMDIARRKGQQEILKMLEDASRSLWVVTGSIESVPVNANGVAWGSGFSYGRIKRELLNTDRAYEATLKGGQTVLVSLQHAINR